MPRRATLLRTLLQLATVFLLVSAVVGTVLVVSSYSLWVAGYVAGGVVWWALTRAIAIVAGRD